MENVQKFVGSLGFNAIRAIQRLILSTDSSTIYDYVLVAENLNVNGFENVMVIVKGGSFVHLFRKESLHDQFSESHVGYFNFATEGGKAAAQLFIFEKARYGNEYDLKAISMEEGLALAANWDSLAEKIVSPDNGGQSLLIEAGYENEVINRFRKAILTSRECQSFESLKRCISRLSVGQPRNKRLRITYITETLDEMAFVFEVMDRAGNWHKIFNGGFILHSDNVWVSHT